MKQKTALSTGNLRMTQAFGKAVFVSIAIGHPPPNIGLTRLYHIVEVNIMIYRIC